MNPSLRTTKSDMPFRYSVNGGARGSINEPFSLTPHALYMRQGNDQLLHVGLMSEFVVGNSVYSALCGASYRMNDAITVHVGLKHKNSGYRLQ